jgi:hypothetical protein
MTKCIRCQDEISVEHDGIIYIRWCVEQEDRETWTNQPICRKDWEWTRR